MRQNSIFTLVRGLSMYDQGEEEKEENVCIQFNNIHDVINI